MLESEWLAEMKRPQWMACVLQDDWKVPRTKAGRRKLRLFACACCRVVWELLPDERLRDAVRVAERFADGLATKDELAAARAAIESLSYDQGQFGRSLTGVRVAIDMAIATTYPRAYDAAFSMTAYMTPLAGVMGSESADAYLCGLFRCLFGNPFRPAAIDPRWRTSTVLGLARAIDEGRTYDRLPILADALEDAECDDDALLAHCRDGGPHARGCWAIDGVLAATAKAPRRAG